MLGKHQFSAAIDYLKAKIRRPAVAVEPACPPSFIEQLGAMLWRDPQERAQLQALGVNIIPCDFYSNIPSIADINESYEYQEPAPYLQTLPLDPARLLDELQQLTEFSHEFTPIEAGDERDCQSFFWNNSQFSYSDAMAYYGYIRKLRPKRIVEIGSGFSTLVAIEAVQRNGSGSIVCTEPYPRPFLQDNPAIELVQKKAQMLTADELDGLLSDGDILFIDSTHTVKTGSDCLHIYLRLLPQIRKDIYVHVHDIFLPFGMPQEWLLQRHIYWTEQYLLLALFIDNPKTEILYGSAYHAHFNPERLAELMQNQWRAGGSSFWFRYRGRL